jgi:hypothetical protein
LKCIRHKKLVRFRNRFEKEVEEVSQDADLDDVIIEEMDMTERNETPQSTAAQTDRYGRKFTR